MSVSFIMGIEHCVYETRYIPRNLKDQQSAKLFTQTYTPDGLVLLCIEEGSMIINAATGELVERWDGRKPKRMEAIMAYGEMLPTANSKVYLSPPSEFEKTLRYVRERFSEANVTSFAPKYKDKLADRLEKVVYRVERMKEGAKSISVGTNYFQRIADLAREGGEARYTLILTRGGSSIVDLDKFERVGDWSGSLYMNLADAITTYERLRANKSQGVIITSGREYEDVLRHINGWILVINGKNVMIEVGEKPAVDVRPEVSLVQVVADPVISAGQRDTSERIRKTLEGMNNTTFVAAMRRINGEGSAKAFLANVFKKP